MSGQALNEHDDPHASLAPGWFGKVVMLGDFAHRRLPPGFISVCDPWLSNGISASRAQLGAHWLDSYLSAPVWRFAWAPGVVNERWWFGVVMPSVDAVGRYFPLVISGSDQNPPMSVDALNKLSIWYAHTGQAALDTLRPGASLDAFEASLAQAPRWQTHAETAPTETGATPDRERHVVLGSPAMAQWAHLLVDPMFGQQSIRHSYWFAQPAQGADSALKVVAGLPDPDKYSDMLEGRL